VGILLIVEKCKYKRGLGNAHPAWPWGFVAPTTRQPLSAEVGTNFVDEWLLLGWDISFAD
jgi:hypothetical protein